MSTRVANHTHAWTHICKDGGYHCFRHLRPLVISNSNGSTVTRISVLKLSTMSYSSVLILAHIIKNNFNSTYFSCLIVPGNISL